MLFNRWLINCEFCPTLQVCWSLQSESRLHLQGELVHLPGQHWENHRRQLWRKRKRLPRRRVNACNLQKSGILWGGRSDNSCQVRKARSSLEKSMHLPAQTNSFTVSVSQESLIKLDLTCFCGWNDPGVRRYTHRKWREHHWLAMMITRPLSHLRDNCFFVL